MELSVAICTAGRPGPCADAVGDVLAQLPPEAECLVVDQSSAGDRARLLSRLPGDRRLRVWSSGIRELPHARNVALAAASGRRIVFLDDDVRLQPGALDALSVGLDRANVGGVVARIRERRIQPNRPAVLNVIGPGGRVLTNLDGSGSGPIDSLKGCAMGFDTRILRGVGGFDRRFGGTAFLEDADASERVRRAGSALWFVGDAVVDHLSAPGGGVRMSAELSAWWRFHNTGLFLAAHRGRWGVRRGQATFSAVAVRLSTSLGGPRAAIRLMDAFSQGVTLASSAPALLSSSRLPSYNSGPENR